MNGKIDDKLVRCIAEFLHDRYEQHSQKQRWQTQVDCRVSFDQLPEANKKVMLATARDLLDLFFGTLRLYSNYGNKLSQKLIHAIQENPSRVKSERELRNNDYN